MNEKIRIEFPNSDKVYMKGEIHPDIKVGMRKVRLTPTVTVEKGEKKTEQNPDVYIYDTSGPYSDPNIEIDLKKGLPRTREEWLLKRGGVER